MLIQRKPPGDWEHAHTFEPIQEGRVYIEQLNGPSCLATKARRRNIERALSAPFRMTGLEMHDSGMFVMLTQSGADLVA